MGDKDDKGVAELKGILCPIIEGGFDNVTGLTLSTAEEEEYVLVGDRHVRQMMEFCREEVRVWGRVRRVGKKKLIDVFRFERV
ncbi:MAG: hypothetical protein PHV85_03395 [Desulfovibrionaceae bacterium]|nr:hypothetical protein [Desulfovibrionaceae bacterium]MDD4951575.1 hypothetical protein [Desulfovibrionaceae bacterium]